MRGFVYGTEDEDRVVTTLLRLLGRENEPGARGKLTRSRVKAHHGGEILLYEGVLKSPKELRRFFESLRDERDVFATLRDEFEARLDEHRVLHFRLDKQEAVAGTMSLGSGGDAFNVEVKYESHKGQPRQGFPFE
jgi:RNA binding exosome subunit